jgi:hypothetical protein
MLSTSGSPRVALPVSFGHFISPPAHLLHLTLPQGPIVTEVGALKQTKGRHMKVPAPDWDQSGTSARTFHVIPKVATLRTSLRQGETRSALQALALL